MVRYHTIGKYNVQFFDDIVIQNRGWEHEVPHILFEDLLLHTFYKQVEFVNSIIVTFDTIFRLNHD